MKFRLRDYFSPLAVLRCHRLMGAAPFWDRERLEQWTRARRAGIVAHACRNVPWYRQRFAESGLRTERLEDPAEWLRVPLTEKRQVRDHGEQFCSEADADGAVWAHTSGSTGTPMRILLDRHVNAAAFALFWRAWSTGGYWRLGQRHAVLKGPLDPGLLRVNGRLRALEIASGQVNADTLDVVAQALDRYRPRFIRCYPSAMYLLCQLLEERGRRLYIPLVITGSETLSPHQRSRIEGVLGARVINHYTHWERAASILECEHGAMHAQEDYGHHEILDPRGRPVGPGEQGEITVTGLHNRAMPMIRYRTGDLGVWSTRDCPCGRSFPVIERLEGRITDLLIRNDGVTVTGRAVANVIKRELWDVRYLQLVQRSPGTLLLKVVPAPGFNEATSGGIMRDILQLLENRMDLELEICSVGALIRSPTGKIRECVNLIPDLQRESTALGLHRTADCSSAG